jgi:peptide/nickel transport system permease protein
VVILRRLALLPFTLVGITLFTFVLVHLAPGDPATLRAGNSRGVTPESIAALRAEYGLDRPLPIQYADWLGRSLRFDFGRSFVDGRPVAARIAEALPVTLGLALLAVALAYLIAVPLGCLLALGEGRRSLRLLEALMALAYAVPTIAIGLLLLRLGAPFGGRTPLALAVAAGCLSLTTVIRVSRHQRSALLSALRADYIQTVRAKGAGPRTVLEHALRNALLPVVTLLGAELAALLSGSVLVEQLFGIQGLGLLAFDSVLARDYPVLLGLTTLTALLTLVAVLLVDLTYRLVDPRLGEKLQ